MKDKCEMCGIREYTDNYVGLKLCRKCFDKFLKEEIIELLR